MKLRIEGNSIRLRLKRFEVEEVCRDGRVEQSLRLGPASGQVLSYAFELRDDIDSMTLEAENGTIAVIVPKADAEGWDTNARVGFEGTHTFPDGATVDLLVEKDFKCLDRPDEEEPDSYPNPTAEDGAAC